MKLIEQDEMRDFQRVLKRFKLSVADFDLTETDTTDSKTDEILAFTGFVVVTQISTNLKAEYPIGDGARWVEKFERDIEKKLFGRSGTSS